MINISFRKIIIHFIFLLVLYKVGLKLMSTASIGRQHPRQKANKHILIFISSKMKMFVFCSSNIWNLQIEGENCNNIITLFINYVNNEHRQRENNIYSCSYGRFPKRIFLEKMMHGDWTGGLMRRGSDYF